MIISDTEHLDTMENHNGALAMKQIAQHLVQRETDRQRVIIDAAIVSLASGNTDEAKELLKGL